MLRKIAIPEDNVIRKTPENIFIFDIIKNNDKKLLLTSKKMFEVPNNNEFSEKTSLKKIHFCRNNNFFREKLFLSQSKKKNKIKNNSQYSKEFINLKCFSFEKNFEKIKIEQKRNFTSSPNLKGLKDPIKAISPQNLKIKKEYKIIKNRENSKNFFKLSKIFSVDKNKNFILSDSNLCILNTRDVKKKNIENLDIFNKRVINQDILNQNSYPKQEKIFLKSENLFKNRFKIFNENSKFIDKISYFYQTPKRIRYSKSAIHNLKCFNDKNDEDGFKIFHENLNLGAQSRREFKRIINYFIFNGDYLNKYNSNISPNQIKNKNKKIKIDNFCNFIPRKFSFDEHLLDSQKEFSFFLNEKYEADHLNSFKIQHQEIDENFRNSFFNTHFHKEFFYKNPSEKPHSNNFFFKQIYSEDNNMENLQNKDFFQEENTINSNNFYKKCVYPNSQYDAKYNNSLFKNLESTNFKTNIKSNISNNRTSNSFRNCEIQFNNITEIKKNLDFSEIKQSEENLEKNPSKNLKKASISKNSSPLNLNNNYIGREKSLYDLLMCDDYLIGNHNLNSSNNSIINIFNNKDKNTSLFNNYDSRNSIGFDQDELNELIKNETDCSLINKSNISESIKNLNLRMNSKEFYFSYNHSYNKINGDYSVVIDSVNRINENKNYSRDSKFNNEFKKDKLFKQNILSLEIEPKNYIEIGKLICQHITRAKFSEEILNQDDFDNQRHPDNFSNKINSSLNSKYSIEEKLICLSGINTKQNIKSFEDTINQSKTSLNFDKNYIDDKIFPIDQFNDKELNLTALKNSGLDFEINNVSQSNMINNSKNTNFKRYITNIKETLFNLSMENDSIDENGDEKNILLINEEKKIVSQIKIKEKDSFSIAKNNSNVAEQEIFNRSNISMINQENVDNNVIYQFNQNNLGSNLQINNLINLNRIGNNDNNNQIINNASLIPINNVILNYFNNSSIINNNYDLNQIYYAGLNRNNIDPIFLYNNTQYNNNIDYYIPMNLPPSVSIFSENNNSSLILESVNINNLPESIYGNSQMTHSINRNDLNNAFFDVPISNPSVSTGSTKFDTLGKSVSSIETELFPFLFNHQLLPPGKENDENFKICLINKIKNVKLPTYHSDFKKKRIHSDMVRYSLGNMMNNDNFNNSNLMNHNHNVSNNIHNGKIYENRYKTYSNFYSDNFKPYKEVLVTKNVYNRQMFKLCEEDENNYKGGLPEFKFIKYRKISSCKRNYNSFISFSGKKDEKFFFKIYRDEDLGFEEKFKKLTKIHEADNDIETDEEQLELAKDHVLKVLQNTIKNFDPQRDLTRGLLK